MTMSLRRGDAGGRGRRALADARPAGGDAAGGNGRRGAGASAAAGSAGSGTGPVRDMLLQARYVSACGRGGQGGWADREERQRVRRVPPARRIVRARSGFLGDVIIRTRPRARDEQWFTLDHDPVDEPGAILTRLYRPTSVLWNGSRFWILLEGDERDIVAQAARLGLEPADKPQLPAGGRWSLPPVAAHHSPRRVRRRGRGWRGPPRRACSCSHR